MYRIQSMCTLGTALFCACAVLADPPARAALNPADGAVAGASAQTQDTIVPSVSPLPARDGWVPLNDACANAIALTGSVVWMPFNNADATDDGPVPSCQSNTHRNIWYCWTAESDGRVDILTLGSSFDTVVAAYDGCDCANLVEIGCDDDGYYEGSQSELQFDVTAGHSYLISIGGWNTNAGLGLLSVETGLPLPTGACCLGDECIGNTHDTECYDQGGLWYGYADCAQFVCGACPEDKLVIDLGTDDHPEETSWQLVDEATGTVVAAAGGYTEPGMPHLYSFCLAGDRCYSFTIYDSAGDGICCEYGSGQYSLLLNDSQVAYGGEFGASETTRVGSGCAWPTGACCKYNDCIGTMTEAECVLHQGAFYIGEDCATFACPTLPVECPATALAGQNAPPLQTIALISSDANKWGNDILIGDNFADVSGTIYGLHWWGVWATDYPTYGPCDEFDPTVEIKFYEDVDGLPGPVTCEYTVVPTWVPTGVFFGDGFEMLYFSVDLLKPPCNLTDGWVSIQGVGDDPSCFFLWVSSDQGDDRSYRFWPMPGTSRVNLSYCLDGAYEPRFGACCEEVTGSCADAVEIIDCSGHFTADTLCDDLSPPCGQPLGACCYADGTCALTAEVDCADNWLGPWTTCEQCPCVLPCPPDAVAEIEACGEDANGGCNMSDPTFNPLTLGVTVCGTLWADGDSRDTDWYQVVTTETMTLTWTVEVEFYDPAPLCGFVPTSPLGTPDCSTVSVIDPYAVGGACEPASVTTICLPPGTHWFFVAPTGYSGLPCGVSSDYVATLTAEPCILLGACCYNDGYDCVDNQASECAALGGEWWIYESCATHECFIPCPEATIVVEVLTDWHPVETRWELTDALTGAVVAAQGPYDEAEHLYTKQICVPRDRCFTFTIFDDYGNGICCEWGEGYYNVYYDGELVRTGGRFGNEQSCDMGSACPAQAWACCVAGACVGDLIETDCAALGGTWTAESRCADGYDCTGEVDFRLTAPVINASGTSCNANNDCELGETDDVEYMVSVPEDGIWSFSLCGSWLFFDTILFVGTTRCGQEIGFNDDFCEFQSQVTASIPAGDYYVTIEGAGMCGRYVLNVIKLHECDGECPPGARPEGEPDCYDDYVDVTNAGCNNYPYVFSPIACGETVCGTSGTYLYGGDLYGDQDWYQVQLSAPASLKWDVCAAFDPLVEIVYSEWGFCEGYYAVASTIGAANVASTAGASVGPGTYWLCVSPASSWDHGAVPCGSPYVATLTVTPNDVCMCGDFDLDNDVDVDDFYFFLTAFGTCVGEFQYQAACDFDGDTCITLVDYHLWRECYRNANGGRQFVIPRPKPMPPDGVRPTPAGSVQAR